MKLNTIESAYGRGISVKNIGGDINVGDGVDGDINVNGICEHNDGNGICGSINVIDGSVDGDVNIGGNVGGSINVGSDSVGANVGGNINVYGDVNG